MATADCNVGSVPTPVIVPKEDPLPGEPRLHRVRTVRLQQGMSLRSAARHMGTDVRSLRLQEREETDLRMSDLHKWQKALDVPLSELVVETDIPLSRPVMERARLIRLMKTVAAIRERAESDSITRMAEMLAEQLIEIMPELEDVSPWHTYGQRRSMDEHGRVVERRLSEDLLSGPCDDD
jgi:transcriptional regulator with XRE-family HTH domain